MPTSELSKKLIWRCLGYLSVCTSLALGVSGCHGQDEHPVSDPPVAKPSAPVPNTPKIPGDQSDAKSGDLGSSKAAESVWLSTSYKSKYFNALIKTLSSDSQKKEEDSYLRATAEPVNLPDFGYSLFRLNGIDKEKQTLFIIPRLLVQSALFDGRVWITESSPGRGRVRFYIALIDGLKSQISTGFGSLQLPSIFKKIGNSQNYQNALGYQPVFKSIKDCPSKLTMTEGAARLALNLSFSDNGCPRNQLLEVTGEDDLATVREWFEARIPKGDVTLNAEFQPKASSNIESVDFELSPLPVFEAFREDIKDNPSNNNDATVGFSVSDIHRRGSRFLKQFFGEASFPGLSLLEENEAVDVLIDRFFEVSVQGCPANQETCLKLRLLPDSSDIARFNFIREKTFPLPLPEMEVSTSILDLGGNIRSFIIPAENTDDSTPPKDGRIGGLLKQVAPGDLVELAIDRIQSKKKSTNPLGVYAPDKSKEVNQVCTSYGPVPTRDETDYNQCVEWNQECDQWRAGCNREARRCNQWMRYCTKPLSRGSEITVKRYYDNPNTVGRYDGDCGSPSCSREETYCAEPTNTCVHTRNTSCKTYGTKKVPSGPAPCTNLENQWVKAFDLSQVVSNKVVDESFDRLDQNAILSGLQIQFSGIFWNLSSRTFESIKSVCPLTSFFPQLIKDGNTLKIQFRVMNQVNNGCVPFGPDNSRPGFYPELSVINKLSFPEQIPCGFREEFWNNRTNYSCPRLNKSSSQPIFETYFPRVDFTGRIRLPGVRFISNSEELK